MPNLPTSPIRAYVYAPPIQDVRVKDVCGSVLLDFTATDHFSIITLYVTPEQARDLANRLDAVADRIDADRDSELIGGAA